MKKNLLYKNWDKILSILLLSIVILIFTQCDGDRSLYLINISDDTVTIKSKRSEDYFQQRRLESYLKHRLDKESKLSDSSSHSDLIIDFYQMICDTKISIKVNGDSISFELKPSDTLRIAQVGHVFGTGRVSENSLQFDNLIIITKSGTSFLRSPEEILSRKRIEGLKIKKVEVWRNLPVKHRKN
jgi:hypothetical protein